MTWWIERELPCSLTYHNGERAVYEEANAGTARPVGRRTDSRIVYAVQLRRPITIRGSDYTHVVGSVSHTPVFSPIQEMVSWLMSRMKLSKRQVPLAGHAASAPISDRAIEGAYSDETDLECIIEEGDSG